MYISLRIKVMALLFFLIAGLAYVFNESAARLIFEKTEETFQERMFTLVNSIRSYWDSEKNQLLRTASLYAVSEKVVNFSIYGLNNLLQREMKRLLANSGFTELEIRLKNGLALSTTREEAAREMPLNEADPLLNISRILVKSVDNGLNVSAVVPIHKLGELVGLLTLKRLLDDLRLKKMARNIQADVAVVVRGSVVASSLSGRLRTDLFRQVSAEPEPHERFFTLALDDRIHSIGIVDIAETVDRQTVRMYCVLSQEKMLSLVESARRQTLRLMLIALVVSLVIAFLFSEYVLISRIRVIRDGSKIISRGDLSHRLPSTLKDELGDLSRSFNEMASHLKENRDSLEKNIINLENLKNYVSNILGSLGTCVITWNRRGYIETVNPSAERELSEFYPRMVGLGIRKFLGPMNPPSRKAFMKVLRSFAQAGIANQTFDLEFDLGIRRGFKVMQGAFNYLRDGNQNPYGVVLTLDNITQRRIIEQQLYHADKLSSIGQLAASVAHEIKNPLASIKTLGQLLQEDTPQRDPKREYIDVIVSEVNRLNRVVEQLLKYAKPEESRFVTVAFSEVITPVLSLVHHEAERHRVEISMGFPEGLKVYVDSEKIKQVFLNLIFNAVQAMPQGGHVKVSATDDPVSQWTICQVEDDGEGMSPDLVSRIFEPFFTTKQRGTGLGLAIVKKIIDLHGGKIEVKSRLKEGTSFTFYLPHERKE